jgi:hypothetical protein
MEERKEEERHFHRGVLLTPTNAQVLESDTIIDYV